MNSQLQKRIEERAHKIWQDEGKPEGRQEEHWRRAQSEISEEEMPGADVEQPVPTDGRNASGEEAVP